MICPKDKTSDVFFPIFLFYIFARGMYAFDATFTLPSQLFEYGKSDRYLTKHMTELPIRYSFTITKCIGDGYCVDCVHIGSPILVKEMTHGVVSKSIGTYLCCGIGS